MIKPKNLRKNWNTLTPSKLQKFDSQNWESSSWKREIDSKLARPGIYCLHDGKRIFYIGESTTGTMKNRWDPTISSSHDFGRKNKKNGDPSGAKWQGQGSFASGTLRFTVENGFSQKVTSIPRLDYISYTVRSNKLVRRKYRQHKKINKGNEEQSLEIKFLEYFLIRKAGFAHGFGGLTPDVNVKKSEFKKIIANREFITKKAILKNGWTQFNKKDGIPYSRKLLKGTNLNPNKCTKIKESYAKDLKIKKVICGGSINPFTGEKGLLGKGSNFANLKDYEANSKAKLLQTYNIQASIKKHSANQSSRTTTNLKNTKKAEDSKGKKAVSKKKSATKKAVSKKKSATKKAVAKKKSATKKAIAKKKPTTKKAVSKKKSATKKAIAKKKPATKKAVSKKKPATKKAVAKKKSATKKAVAKKKPAAKKAPSKKKQLKRKY